MAFSYSSRAFWFNLTPLSSAAAAPRAAPALFGGGRSRLNLVSREGSRVREKYRTNEIILAESLSGGRPKLRAICLGEASILVEAENFPAGVVPAGAGVDAE